MAAKIIHRAVHGVDVHPLCDRRRVVDMRSETWTDYDERVTCMECLDVLTRPDPRPRPRPEVPRG